MSDSDDPVELLARALRQAADVVAATRPEQGALPTPCRSWDVTGLVSHLLGDLRQSLVRANGGTPDWKAPTERVTEDWEKAFRTGAEELIAAWQRAGDLSGVLDVPGMGEVPARFPVDQQIVEFAVHTWDLATATGQSTDLDETVGRTALDWGRGALRPEFRGAESEGHDFGPEIPIGTDAPVYDQLAAWAGRWPAGV
ncbi:TIGR03086 family metal-binding protein [Kitasatospora indigofera]|uniref:TIGR03086 family metal-binding protein n=1 Tax=Kitasatospora indigofera TaxID=67307 RepID=UPI0036BA5282